jgi:hypothetical protein
MLTSFEDDFAELLDGYSLALQGSYEKLKTFDFSLDELDYSKLVANRVRAYYQAQDKTKNLLNKRKAQAGSDFFVETVLFALKLFNDSNNLGLEIVSEKALQRKRKSITPDISLWRNGTCVAAIECKTQLGYQKFSWLSQFESREIKLQEIFPEAKMFLLVMTSCNWHGFDTSEPRGGFNKDDLRVGEKFFCLLAGSWPVWMPEELSRDHFHQPIEQLLAKIQLLA